MSFKITLDKDWYIVNEISANNDFINEERLLIWNSTKKLGEKVSAIFSIPRKRKFYVCLNQESKEIRKSKKAQELKALFCNVSISMVSTKRLTQRNDLYRQAIVDILSNWKLIYGKSPFWSKKNHITNLFK